MTSVELLVACRQAEWQIRTAVFLHASELFCNRSEGEKEAATGDGDGRSEYTSG